MTERLYFLDWLRVLAVGCVFWVHCLLPFAGGSWIVIDADATTLVAILVGIFNQFGIPLLFLVSGAGVWYALHSRTAQQFIQERFQRLIIPFIFGIVLFSPIQTYFHLRQNKEFDGTLFHHYLPQFFRANHFTTRDFQWVGSYGYHLWFLFFLFAFSLVSLSLFIYLRQRTHIIDFLASVSQIKGASLLFVIPLLIAQVLLRSNFSDYLSWADFVFWLIFFIYGYILVSDKRFIEAIQRDFNSSLITLIISTVMIIVIYIRNDDKTAIQDAMDFYSNLLLFTIAVTINSWASMSLLLAITSRYLNWHQPILDKLNENALPFYLFHQPPIVVIGFFVTRWEISSGVKFVIIFVVSLLITITLYQTLIKLFPFTRILMGMRPVKSNR